MKLRCLRDCFLFAFLQKTTKDGVFVEETKWGFQVTPNNYFQGKDNAAFTRALEKGRWVKVLITGPDCKEVKQGDTVCLESQMWTNGFNYDGVQIRKSDESKVLMVATGPITFNF